jgi:hypothetical protein
LPMNDSPGRSRLQTEIVSCIAGIKPRFQV